MFDIWPLVDNKKNKLYNEKGLIRFISLGSSFGDMASSKMAFLGFQVFRAGFERKATSKGYEVCVVGHINPRPC